jgi:uncharacterized protein YcfJ
MRNVKFNLVNGMRVTMAAPVLIAAVFATPALATDQYIDTARVISVTPKAERINVPQQECRTEYQQQSYSQGGNSITGALIGGIAGGLLGNTVGKGSGRVAAAAVGAGVGAVAGDRIANSRQNVVTRTVPVQTCYQVDQWQTVNAGYFVTYEYNGRTYNAVTTEHPGRYVDVSVAVAPNRYAVSQVSYLAPDHYRDNQWRGNRGHDRTDWKNNGRDDRRDRDNRRYY